ncbi:CopC domain-containing protein [Algoriphagus ratkowskyi]|uniref:CopC domain-containing protein n=1 Tax=Algoriphagus ratkowskyi TaxID=57028 RepID=A0A2W7ST47_9BACT|nr:copper resistance protein CopC [Algoriphagus ratkowskyi]PZX53862.1 CopC domain-containing protein [Algoriphagus ratkowskyi]TXD76733.1 copper resistance protein CopC [Algoriphagus ratkowskyi]
MKALFTVVLASALSFSSLAASASEDLKALSTVHSNYKKISVTLTEGLGKATISILDADGKSLSSRNVRVKKENMMVPYDLKNLPAGEYQVKIETGAEQVIYTVETKDKPVATEALPLMASVKIVDNNTVNLSVMGLEEAGVDVKIYSKVSDEVIYTDHIIQAEGFRKDYSFSKMNVSDIYFIVTDSQGRSKTFNF